MKNLIFLNRSGMGPDGTSRKGRYTLDPILSRLCLASLICLCLLTLGSGNVWGTTVSVVAGTYNKQANVEVTGNGSYIFMFGTSSDAYVMQNATSGSNYLGRSSQFTSLPSSITITTSPATNTSYFWSVTDYDSKTSTFKLCGPNGYCYCSASGKLKADQDNSSTWHIGTTSGVIYMIDGNSCYVKNTGTSGFRAYSTASNRTQLVAVYKLAPSCTPLTMSSVTAEPGNGSISLSWSAVDHADSYTVTCKNKSTGVAAGTGTGSKTGTSCTISGLTNGTEYTWSVEPVGSGTYCSSNTPATGDATPNVYYTVTWNNNGSEYTTTSVANGSKPTFPSNPSSCDGTSTTFVGWTPTPWSGKLDDISAKTIYTSGSAMPNVSGPVTYHAVFAKVTANTYKKGTKADLTDGQTVLIVNPNNSYAMSSNTGSSSGRLAAVSVTISAGKITKNDATLVWTVETSSSNYKFKQGTKYLWANSSNNQLYASSSYEDAWSVTAQSSHYIIHNVSVNKDLEYYSPNFTTYNTGTGVAYQMDFYIPDYSQYLTTCCTDPGLAYGTGSVTKTYGASAFTNTLTNSHNVGVTYDSSDPTVATVNGSGQVTILKAGSTTITASSTAQTVAAVSYCADEASYTLTVNKANISPTLSYESGTLVIGNNSSSPTVGGNSGSGTVTYAITTESTSGVVTLNTSTGVVTAAKEGTATITATIPATTNYNGGSATANFTVTCGAPSSVDISGNYQFYPGETISLTATPTGGAGTPVTYQWKKDGVNIVGATSATYTKDDATVSDAGSYTCTVQYGSNCATTSDAFKLKCMQFYLKTSGGADISNHALTKVDATHATLSLSLTGGTTYKFRVTDGCGDWYGNTGEMTSSNCTNWAMDADADCRVTTSSKSATYVFNFDFSGGLLGSEMKVSVVYPSSNQASGKVIYWDNEVNKWNGSKLWYRIGKNNHNANTQLSKVAGTANFYSVTTSQYDGFEYWHIANNVGQGTGNIFWTKDNSGSGLEITNAMGFEGAPVTDATVTVTPTTTHSTGGSSDNNNCEFYTYSITSGVKSYTVTSSATNCTVAMEKYNNDAGSSTTALASGGTVMPTQYVKVTVTPNTGYQFSSVSVTNGTTVKAAAAGTPGVYYITGNATVTATCTAKICTVNFDKNSGSGGDASTTATYGLALPTVSVPSRTGYTFDGYWDAETNNNGSGTQYYSANGICTRNWDKDVTADQTLYAKWNAKQYTIELDREGASTGAESVTATYDAGTLAGWSAPSKTGYTFGGYWSDDNGTGTLVISTSGVLQNSVTISAVAWTNGSGHWVKDGGVTVYAKWTANVYNITYKDQGDVAYSGNKTDGRPTGNPATHTYGSATALVDGVKDGYRFDGWFTDASCTVSAGSSIGATAKTADFTLYAKWTQVRTVTWSVNGSTWSSGVVEGNTHVISGEKVSALPTAPTKSDCDDSKVFVGWKAAEIDGVSVSDPGGIFTTQAGSPTISANTTFYAVFADKGKASRTTLYEEPFKGTAGSNTAWASAGDYFNNANTASITTTSSWKVSKYTTECSDNDGASGGSHMFCGSASGNIIFNFGNKSTYTDLVLSFNYRNNAGGGLDRTISCTVSGDGGESWSDNIIDVASVTTQTWNAVSYNVSNSSTSALQVKWTATAANPSRVDDIKLTGCLITYSNYVTTCSSCDADATFTNTTPAVSAIGCTGATLTATGGLATLGAAGCNVSDYGFVIGTADNPAIGGVGVTKYQVGTTNPTTGEDFSYDATGLTKGTHYYIRAYAINRHGTAYSSSTNFWTNNVSSIAITTAPTKKNYIVDETFDATGMVVTATMASGATEDVTSDVTYSSSALTAGTSQNFAINYTLCETAKSVNQVINVYTLTVTEGSNPTYGTASGSANIVSITGLGEHKTYTVTVTSSNATAVDNGDNTWSIINPTGNVAVRVDYADAVQVKVYYKVDGVTVTGLTQDVYQSETTTLPTASELATAMTAQSMDIPDDDYPNFIGWSETEFPAQTAEPTIVTGTPTINAEKTYYAVYTNINKKSITPSAFSSTYASNDGENTIDGVKYEVSNICTQSSKIQFRSSPGYLYSKGALAYIKKIEITGLDLIVNACSDNAGTLDGDAITPTGTAPYVYTFPASKQYFKIKGKGGTDKVSLIEIFYANTTVYYMTEFCATKVTLSHNSPEHGTVEFSRSSIATCGSDKNVSLTIIPDAGYKLTGWTVNTASGYADAKTTNPAVVTTNNNSAAQNITLTFAQDANKNYDVTATFGLMTVTSWAWTLNSAAIPDPLNLYIGQTARFDVAYTPAGVDNSKKTYTRTKEDAYINWSGAQQATYSTISGKASTGENTTPVTFTHADGPTTTVNVKVLPLPAVHFGDIVHNVEFADVVATLSDNALSPTKTTPTHADFDGATKNTCEEEHLHLVGWIREDWPALVTYLNGGAQPSTDDITGAGNDGSGNAYFFAPGASINTQTFNGVTFYAVWAKVE